MEVWGGESAAREGGEYVGKGWGVWVGVAGTVPAAYRQRGGVHLLGSRQCCFIPGVDIRCHNPLAILTEIKLNSPKMWFHIRQMLLIAMSTTV